VQKGREVLVSTTSTFLSARNVRLGWGFIIGLQSGKGESILTIVMPSPHCVAEIMAKPDQGGEEDEVREVEDATYGYPALISCFKSCMRSVSILMSQVACAEGW
jgi:hypothetical protein